MLRGHLDHATRCYVSGWALDAAHPDEPATVEIRIDGALAATLVANLDRQDLEGLGAGTRHGFELFLPGLDTLHRHVVSARIAGGTNDLPNSPIVIEAAGAFDASAEASLRAMIAAADVPSLERTAGVLSDLVDTILERRAAVRTQRDLRDLKYRWFAARGDSLQPPSLARRALIVVSEATRMTALDAFLAAAHARTLRDIGFEVTLAAADLHRSCGDEAASLEALGIDLPGRPFLASIEELLHRERHGLEAVVFFGHDMACRYRALAAAHAPRAVAMLVDSCADRAARLSILRADPPPMASIGEAPAFALPAFAAPWSVALEPDARSFDRRRGLLLLDDPGDLAPLALDLLLDAVDRARALVPDLRVFWPSVPAGRVAGPHDVVLATAGGEASSLRSARLALTVSVTPGRHRHVLEALARGLPCIAPRAIVDGLALPPDLVTCDVSKAHDLAAAVARLHEDRGHHAWLRKQALDHLDEHHAPAAVALTWRAALRTRRPRPVAPAFLDATREPALLESMAC